MLVGKELLEKSKLLSKKSEEEIARGDPWFHLKPLYKDR